jgi:hypothetical protein
VSGIAAQQHSSATRDYVKDGFLATRREDEILCAGMVAEVLASVSDVTNRVTAAVAGKTGDEFIKARDAQIADLEKEGCAGKEDKYSCEVVTMYQGGQYKLYNYRKYTDARLVFAPEGDTAFFGGDPDNFNFPRYDLDCSFVRLYENGKPAATPDHLRWSTRPPNCTRTKSPARSSKLSRRSRMPASRFMAPAYIPMRPSRCGYPTARSMVGTATELRCQPSHISRVCGNGPPVSSHLH